MNGNFPVPQEAVEAGLLSAIAQNPTNWLEIGAAGIGTDDFSSHREVYNFISSYMVEYGSLPSANTISTRYDWHPPIGDFPYWMKEMKRYILARKVLEVVQEGYNAIAEPETALDMLLNNLSLIRSQQSNHISATDAGAAERLDNFDARTEYLWKTDRVLGLRTGLKIIDDTRVGWMPGDLIGIYSRPGLGKTWWLMWQGAMAWHDGKTVLAITPEMPANRLNLRIDVMLGQMMGLPLDYGRLMRGDPALREQYERVTQLLEQSQRWWTYDSLNDNQIGLGEIIALTRQHKPDIILVDGLSLLKAPSRGQTWEQVKELSYGLKNIATIYEVPIIMTHQAVNTLRGRRTEIETNVGRGEDWIMPSLNDAAYGDAFVQACSDVITMVGAKETENIIWYSIRKHRERGWESPVPVRMGLAVDFGKGKIIDLSERGYNPQEVWSEAMRLLGLRQLGS